MKDWTTKFELYHCEHTENPKLFNLYFERKGGLLGYSKWGITLRENELKELNELIQTSLLKETE